MDQYKLDELKARLQMIRYWLSRADQRGYTHGDKHHIIQVCLMEIQQVLHQWPDGSAVDLFRHETTDPLDISQIPF